MMEWLYADRSLHTAPKQGVNLRYDRRPAERRVVFRNKYLKRIVVAVLSAPDYSKDTAFVRHYEMSVKVRFRGVDPARHDLSAFRLDKVADSSVCC
jgi:hypothetical protein